LGIESVAQVDMEDGRSLLQADRPPNVFDGQLVLARLVSQHSEKMNRVGLARFDGQNLPVDLLSSLPTASLVVFDGNR
jgi:hypothetical protein